MGEMEAIAHDTDLLIRQFIDKFCMLDSDAVNVNEFQEFLPLKHDGKNYYPAFMFDANGRVNELLGSVVKALPSHLGDWQVAFWLVSPNEFLDGECPYLAIEARNQAVLDAARIACEEIVG